MKFEDFEIKQEIKKAVAEQGLVDATKIQEEAIPYALMGHDVIGQAQTGTGKTMSFMIPIVEKIDESQKSVQAIVLAPTRELAVQIHEEFNKLTKYMNIKTMSVYGGDSIEKQIKKLNEKPHIVIGTPGRTIDLMNRKKLKLHEVSFFVLDEVDEMLNMGFIDDVETIFKAMPKHKQTVFYSATLEKRIKALCNNYMVDPKHIKVEAKSLTVDKVEQTFIVSKQNLKAEVARDIILLRPQQKIIIFVQTKRYCDEMYEYLISNKFRVQKIHGDIVQTQRLNTIKEFKNGKFDVLIATDVVARGIDIDDIDLVINMQLPQDKEYYIHRIGRTGRGNSIKGEAISLVTSHEYSTEFRHYDKYLKTTIKEVSRPSKKDIIDKLMLAYFENINESISSDVDESYTALSEMLLANHDQRSLVPYLLKLLYPQLSESYRNKSEDNAPKSGGGGSRKGNSNSRSSGRSNNRNRDRGNYKSGNRDSYKGKKQGNKKSNGSNSRGNKGSYERRRNS